MGIPYYVASLVRQHKHIQKDCGNARLETNVLGIDFNCFIHKYLDPINPIGSVVLALERFLIHHASANHILVAFDGLVPYSKIVQQRYRRMRTPTEVEAFDKHQISPGTEYMRGLEEALRVVFPHLAISGTDEPGEGEHKIFQWIRKFDRSETRKICIYGLDADLVLISVAQSELGDIQLLREKNNAEWEFATVSVNALKAVLPIDANKFVEMSVLCFGNDFMPSLAMFSLREEGYNRALHYFGRSNGLESASKDEANVLTKRAKETDTGIVSRDGHAIETRLGLHLMDGVLDWEKVCFAFWKTYEWTLHYFKTSEVLDWCWYYPYAEAPLVKTLTEFNRLTKFAWSFPTPPFDIDDQLRFILPARSLKETPVYPDEMYHEGPDSRHLWMKKFAWESDPFISLPWNPAKKLTTARRLDALRPCKELDCRNLAGTGLLQCYDCANVPICKTCCRISGCVCSSKA